SILPRSIFSIAADMAYSVRHAGLLDGAPALVWPPCATYMMLVASSMTIPLVAWFSSDRGKPFTTSTLVHDVPFQVSLEMMPELVSRLRSPAVPPPPMRGSLEAT